MPFILFMLVIGLLIAELGAVHSAPAATLPPQAQASTLAVPDAPAAPPSSVIVVMECHKVIALMRVDAGGDVHPVAIEGMSATQVSAIEGEVPADHVIGVTVPCATTDVGI